MYPVVNPKIVVRLRDGFPDVEAPIQQVGNYAIPDLDIARTQTGRGLYLTFHIGLIPPGIHGGERFPQLDRKL
jgi:hypothetical protein